MVDKRAGAREAQAEAAYPPTGQFVMVGSTRVHADVRGTGPDLVLIHGASGNSRDFTFSLAKRLSESYRVISFDRPGFGYTDAIAGTSPADQADLLRAAADQLGAHHPIVLGQSYGGAVALAWALSAPDGPAALVLVSAASMPWPGRNLGPWYEITASPFGGATVVPLATALVPPSTAERFISAVFAPETAPAGYAEYIGAGLTLRRATLRINSQQLVTLREYLRGMVQQYPQITQPVELVHGDADTIVPLAVHSEPLSHMIPGAHLTVIKGAGHMPHHTHEAEVIAAIARAAARAGL